MRWKRTLIYIVIGTWLTLLFAVPAFQLLTDPWDGSRRWGWQMYSRAADIEWVEVTYHDGLTEDIEPSEFFVSSRGEVHSRIALPAMLCRLDPTLEQVTIHPAISDDAETHRC